MKSWSAIIGRAVRITKTEGPLSLLRRARTHIKRQEGIAPTLFNIRRPFTFVTYEQMIAAVRRWCNSLPRDCDAVVGIPRSGVLIAAVVALRLGKPLSVPELLPSTWQTRQQDSKRVRKLLLIDDSVATGQSMANATAKLNNQGYEVTTAVVFFDKRLAEYRPDLYYKEISAPAQFEWALAHQKGLGVDKVAMDLDGVICEDCPEGIDSDERQYLKWLQEALPALIPSYTIDIIISNRLERYRKQTEACLAQYGVKYDKLYLWDLPNKGARGELQGWVRYKADILKVEKPGFYLESSASLSKALSGITDVPIVCLGGR